MEHRTPFISPNTLGCALALGCLTACGESHQAPEAAESHVSPLVAQCAEGDAVPDGAWVCPAALSLECGEPVPETLYVVDSESSACEGTLSVSAAGPFAPGAHVIAVTGEDGSELCSAELEVVDDEAPVLESHVVKLWPPNHKLHSIAVEDCVSAIDSCDGDLQGEFIWASSDEPIDDIGDGHHSPDVGLGGDTGTACVRAERQGPKDGRVYTLGVRVVDRAGNESLGSCQVIVDHDQRGVTGSDSGESYRVELDPATAGINCDGTPGDDDEGEAGSGGAGGASGAGAGGVGGGSGAGAGGVGGGSGAGGASGAGAGGVGGEGGEGGSAGNGGQPLPDDVI
jgi:hypothetical protein